MKAKSLLFLRLSIGMLLVVWGIDKLVDVEHALAVSRKFYWNLFSAPVLLAVFGVVEILLGLLVGAGLARRACYPLVLVILGFGALAAWRSIIGPWGWVLDGSNVLFYPSLIILAGAVVLRAFQDQDTLVLARSRDRPPLGFAGSPPIPSPSRPMATRDVPRVSRLSRSAVRRALVTSAVVGSALTLINQSPKLASGVLKPSDLVRIGMNYMIPFLVATYSAYASAPRTAPGYPGRAAARRRASSGRRSRG